MPLEVQPLQEQPLAKHLVQLKGLIESLCLTV